MRIYDELLKDFAITKQEKETVAETNLRQALRNAEFKEIYNNVRKYQFDIAKASFNHKDTTVLIKSLQTEKEKLYVCTEKLGYKNSDFKPNYSCSICKDTGKVANEYCSCFKRALSEKLLSCSGLETKNLPSFDTMKFDIITDESQKQNYKKVCEFFQKYLDKMQESDKKIITLSGDVGVGKTYLLKAVANTAISKGFYTLYTTAFALNKDFLAYHCARLDEKDAILEKYLQCDLLLIDDLGTENILKNVTLEYLYLIINQRLENGKNTIITTNLRIDELRDVYDERIVSRLTNKKTCVPYLLSGEDLRHK